jgi:hypothetical protein
MRWVSMHCSKHRELLPSGRLPVILPCTWSVCTVSTWRETSLVEDYSHPPRHWVGMHCLNLERHFPHGSFQSSSQALGRYALSKPGETLPSWQLPVILPGHWVSSYLFANNWWIDLCSTYLERYFPHGSFQSSSQALGQYVFANHWENDLCPTYLERHCTVKKAFLF